jgi:hypothetical protein
VLRAGDDVLNARTYQNEKIARLFLLHATSARSWRRRAPA